MIFKRNRFQSKIVITLLLFLPASSTHASERCLAALHPSMPAADAIADLVISNLAHLRIAIDDATEHRRAVLAHSLSNSYKTKLEEAVGLKILLGRLPVEIEKLKTGARSESALQKERRTRTEENERDLLDWVRVQTTQHAYIIHDMILSTDGSQLITKDANGNILHKGAGSGKKDYILEGSHGGGGIGKMQFAANDSLLLTSSYAAVTLWDAETGNKLKVIKHSANTGGAFTAAITRDERRIATYTLSDKLELWDATGEKRTAHIDLPQEIHPIVEFSPDSKYLVAAADSKVGLYDADSGVLIAALIAHGKSKNEIRSAIFSESGEQILTATKDGSVVLWNGEKGNLEHRLELGHVQELLFARFNRDGTEVLIGADDAAYVFSAATGQLLHILKAEGGARVRSAAFNPVRNEVIVSYSNPIHFSGAPSARIWNLDKGKFKVVPGLNKGSHITIFRADGNAFCTTDFDKTVVLWQQVQGAQE